MESVFWLAIALVSLFYLAAPLFVYASQRGNLRPHIQPLLPGKTVPVHAQEFTRYASSIRALGFDAVGTGVLMDMMPSMVSFVRLFVHRTRGQQVAILSVNGGRQSHCYVEFMTIQADGLTVCTGNSSHASSFEPDARTQTLQAVDRVDASTLYRLHQYREMMLLDARQPRYLPPAGQEMAAVAEGVGRDFYRQTLLGRFRRRGNEARPTLVGAFAMTWGLLPPLKQLRAARARRHARLEWAAAERSTLQAPPVQVTHDKPRDFERPD